MARRYNRACMDSTLAAARKQAASDGRERYIQATGYGYLVTDTVGIPWQGYVKVTPRGQTVTVAAR